MENEVRIPDIEVIINAAAWEVAIISFYARKDIHQGFEVLAGVTSRNEIASIRAILQSAIEALSTDDWVTVDELRATAGEGSGEAPF